VSAPATTTTFIPAPVTTSNPDVTPLKDGRKLCVRHNLMANQNVNAKLQKSLDTLSLSERAAITSLWSTFSTAPNAKRKLILEGILTMCCFSQLSHISDSLNKIIRIDPFSLLPREASLRVLGFLDAMSLGKVAQVSKSWKALADDDLLWRRMCGQHIDRKCEKCGWGLPLLERRRLKVELKDGSPSAAIGVGKHEDHGSHSGSRLVTRVEALGGKGPELRRTEGVLASMFCDPAPAGPGLGVKRSAPASVDEEDAVSKRVKIELAGSESPSIEADEEKVLTREVRLTRPWKSVYCERLVVERNWRKGRCTTKTLKGHTDGIMCLQYHTALTSPSYPVLITGSYDRTIRVWNLDTCEEVRFMHGHTRAVRTLQFDQRLLFTGSMDGTVRMWNWRAGDCMRVLEGHTDGVISLNYNGYLLASGSADTTIQVWNFRTGGKFTLRGHDEWVNSVVLWDGKSSPGDMDPTSMPSFSMTKPKATADKNKIDIEKGSMLFSGSDDGTIKLWDLVNQTCIRTFTGHKGQVQSLKVIMVDMSEEEILAARREKDVSPARSPFASASIALPNTSSSAHLAIESAPHGFNPLEYRTRRRTEPIEPKCYVHSDEESTKSTATIRGSVDSKEEKRPVLISGSLDGTVKVWDVEKGRERSTLFGHIEGVWAVDIDALRMTSASHDRTIKVWDRESGNCVQTLVGHRGAVTSLQLSDDMIISGSDDGDVMIWSFAPNPIA
ncbi:F-box and WD-40 domain protein MET30, partial [Tremellales sp. Uapishka_1]